MSCTYGGVPLSIPTPDAVAWVEKHVTPEELLVWTSPDYDGAPSWARDHQDPLPHVSLGKLYYPMNGASDFAIGYFLATDNQLAQIRPLIAVQEQNASSHGLTLTLSSPDGEENGSISVDLWMLPPRPLVQFPGQNGLWLLTFVDDRYFWVTSTNAGYIDVNPGVTQWLDLFNACTAAAQEVVTVDPIPAAYLFPSDSLKSRQDTFSTYLDALALNVGHRIVRKLDASVQSQNNDNALAAQVANLSRVKKLMSGGVHGWLQPNPSNFPADLTAGIPTSIQVIFPRADQNTNECVTSPGTVSDKTYTVTVPLANLNLPEYQGVTMGIINTSKTIKDSVIATFPANAVDPSNLAVLQALSNQIATDWYRRMAAGVDMKIDGIFNWTPEARNKRIIWTYRTDEVSTRVQRDTLDDALDGLNHHYPATGSLAQVFTGGTLFTSPVTFEKDPTPAPGVGRFLAKLTKKCYTGSSSGLTAYTKYEWTRVVDSDSPNPITYTASTNPPDPPPLSGTCSNCPAYEINNHDLPVSNDLTNPTWVYLRKGHGAYYLIDTVPLWEIVEKTGPADVNGYFPANRLVWDQTQNPPAWKVVEAVLLIDANSIPP